MIFQSASGKLGSSSQRFGTWASRMAFSVSMSLSRLNSLFIEAISQSVVPRA
jgi:hypothetical protein